jgi:hypothetical protein
MQAYRVVVAGSVLVLALLGVSMPAVASEFNGIEPRDFSTVCTHDASVNPPFSDVGVPHNIAVNCAARFNLVKGVGDGLYHPWAPLRRDQAATVVRNWLETAFGFALPDETDHPFTDLDGNVHAGAIALLTDIGIVGGVTDELFAPGKLVTRGQFATLMRRAISYADQLTVTGELPPDASVPFLDLAGNPHAANVQAIAAIGVLTGFVDGTARPGDPVSRGQLATFLMRAAAYLHTFDRWEQTTVPRTFTHTFTVTQTVDEQTTTLYTVPARLVVYGFTGEIALRLNFTERDAYLAAFAADPDNTPEDGPAKLPVTFAPPGLTLTTTDGTLVALLSDAETMNTQTGVYDTVISENQATTRFSVLARTYDQFQLRLSLSGKDPQVVTLSPPE